MGEKNDVSAQMETCSSDSLANSDVVDKIDKMEIQASTDNADKSFAAESSVSDAITDSQNASVLKDENEMNSSGNMPDLREKQFVKDTNENAVVASENIVLESENGVMQELSGNVQVTKSESVGELLNKSCHESLNEKSPEFACESAGKSRSESVSEAGNEVVCDAVPETEKECTANGPAIEPVSETSTWAKGGNTSGTGSKSLRKNESSSESANEGETSISDNSKNVRGKYAYEINDSITTLKSDDVSVSKTVALHVAEEGELDYEEEEIADAETHNVDHEEGEIMDDKDAEGSEEGEIVSDDDDKQVSTKENEKEEGEINEDDLEEGQLDEEVERGHRPRTLCKYYDAGTCRWGAACRFLHPGINDKGNYLMHRPPGMYPTAFGKPPPPSEIGPLNPIIQRGPVFPSVDMHAFLDTSPIPVDLERPVAGPAKESAWERGLKKAKEIKLISQKRREEDEQFEEKRMNLGVKESQKEPEKTPITARREQRRPGFERENQADNKFTQRARPADFRQETSERRFNRSRKSPTKRYDQERERGSRSYDFDKEKPRDMDRERFLRLQRRGSPTPPEKLRDERDRNRERERDKVDSKRDRRPDFFAERNAEKGKESKAETTDNSERKEKPDIANEEKPKDVAKGENPVGVARSLEAEQWRDPWMRTQTQPIKSPDGKSPPRGNVIDDNFASGDSSASDSESDSDESDESGSGSDSESKESSGEEIQEVKQVDKPTSAATQSKAPQATAISTTVKDPLLKNHSSKDNTPKRESPQLQRDSNRTSDKLHNQRSQRDPRDHDRRRRPDEPERKRRDKTDDRDRRNRDRREGYNQNMNSFPQWHNPHQAEASWQRGGHHQFSNTSYRGIPDRTADPRRLDGDPRLSKGERKRDVRRSSPVRSPRSSPHSRKSSSVRDPRRRGQEINTSNDKDRKQISQEKRGPSPSNRRSSPKQKDPRVRGNNADSSKRSVEDKRGKETTKIERNGPQKEKVEEKQNSVEQTKKVDTKIATAHSDVSEDEFESPKYGESASESDSDSDTGSESDSESEAESEIGSASPSESANELSNSDSNDSDSDSDNDSSSSEDISPSNKKEIEKKKKDFKMVLSAAKTSSTSHKVPKTQNPPKSSTADISTRDSHRIDPKSQIGQKRPLSERNSSNASPKGSKTAARKDELLKELKAIEDAIARKRAKMD